MPGSQGRGIRVNPILSGIGERLAHYLAKPGKRFRPAVVSGRETHWQEYIQPGDVLLVEGTSRISTAIKYLTQSTWSHAAICVGTRARDPLVEADVLTGVTAVPFTKYADSNVRICRPVGLAEEDLERVVQFVVARIGNTYDLKNVMDLARYLWPMPPVPARWRRKLLTFGSGEPTKAICSSLIAEAFSHVRYPILPDLWFTTADAEVRRLVYLMRHHSSYTPRDFDLSPYFAIVKPTIEHHFDYRRFPWHEQAGVPEHHERAAA
jgi:hypothetical protein